MRSLWIQIRSYSYFIPTPEMLREFEEIVPGTAKIIVDRFKEQGEHRQKLESTHLVATIGKDKRGQWMAFIVLLVAIICGSFLVWQNKPVSGLITSIAALATALTIFIYGKSKDARNMEPRNQGQEKEE